ncbi:MAG: Crp/Fnr family transcriptional regulator [Lactobacillus sp.]|jgi:CRP-like cAMP-binding protein|nr:Crp/Fnr family transcriptional regulator [Lactobacillus sp.]
MQQFYPVLLKSTLFRQITANNLAPLLAAAQPMIKTFTANERIWQAGEQAASFGLVGAGTVQILKEDAQGNRTIVATVSEAGIFGEAYAYASTGPLPVSVDASTNTTVLFFEPKRLLNLAHLLQGEQLLSNLLQILARKSLLLNQKVEILSQRKIADKVLTFLQLEAKRQTRKPMLLPYNRQEMADFLGVERSALSAALSSMKKAGLIDYRKNEFTLF